MATVAAPIDATSTAAWKALEAHQEKLEAEGIDLKAWFAADAERVNKLSFDAGDLHFDLSKNLVTDETVKLLCDLAREVKLEERRDAMFSGEHINTTEDRAVLHTALRRPASEKGQLIVDGQDVVADVHEVLDRMYAFAERVRSGEWKGVTGKKIEHLVSIGIDGSDEQNAEAVAKHFVAVSTALEKVEAFGIDPANAFGFWNWVGGRYSVDSAVGLSLIVVLGPERFQQFLEGFHAIDEYFCNTPLENNAVALMGLLNVWYVNFFGSKSHAVLPYCQYLHRFPAYLQQLTMESNGKHVRWDGGAVTSDTGEIFWGEPGTNGQHAFYQLLHQGTVVVPADFIAFANTANPATDSGQDVHELFLGNFLAQTKALAFGKTADEVRAEGTPEQIVPARCFEGNRPTTSIFGDTLTPFALGELIALYEHITFVEGTVWGIDSYDQWGVELGKQLAKQITPAFHDDAAKAEQDASTQALIEFYRAHRK